MDHDGGYHLLFSHPEMVEDLLKTFVPEVWVKQLDFSTLQRVNAKLHAEGLKRREGDMIYRVNLISGEAIYLYLLLEFQSSPDPWMAVRVLTYVGLLYEHLVRGRQLTSHKLLPPVFPLVLYNGDKAWSYPTQLADLIDLPPDSPLRHWQPNIQYYLLEENRYKNKKVQTITGYLFQFENCFDYNAMNGVIRELDQYLAAPAQASLRRAFAIWIRQVLAPSKGLSLDDVNTEDLSEVKDMLAERVKQWEKELIEQGEAKGFEQGEYTLLKHLIEKRFGPLPDWAIEKLNTADRRHLEHWGLQLFDASTLEAIFTELRIIKR